MPPDRSGAASSGPNGRGSPPSEQALLRTGLPFGAVMATGAASQLTDLAGVGGWRVPLLWLTIVVACWATGSGLVGLVRGRGEMEHLPAHARFGEFTVPVGLAVIGVGLARTPGPAALAGAVAAVLLAWVASLLLTVTVAVPAVARVPGPDGTTGGFRVFGVREITGVWFIGPAAYLAAAAGTAALSVRVPPAAVDAVGWLAVVGCWVGVLAYAVAVVFAVVRVRARGLTGAPRVAWWIVAGCGGLAADALGHVGRAAPSGGIAAYGWVALACWVVAGLALVPVGAASLSYLLRLRHVSVQPPWPPAFSSAVYALGTAQVGILFRLPWAVGLAHVVAIETLVVWAVTSTLRVGGLAWHLRPRRTPAQQ